METKAVFKTHGEPDQVLYQLIQRNHFLPWYRFSPEHWVAIQLGRHRIAEYNEGKIVSRCYTTMKEFQDSVSLQILFLGTPLVGVNPELYERFRNDDVLQTKAIEAVSSWHRDGTPNAKRRLAQIRMFCLLLAIAKEEGRSIEEISMEGHEADKNLSQETKAEIKAKGSCLATPILIEEMIKTTQQ
ncbi:MAG: hypothetical protein Q8P05_06075 [Candidatus Diapherotrites archaeon]|nr:hypothetical protein [Candidatus Diapherotrites archaeon]